MVGLDSSGKTTILKFLKHNEFQPTIPTLGYEVETVPVGNVQFNIWDVGGQEKVRPQWRHYFTGADGLIFVIDAADSERLDEAGVELHRILVDDQMEDAILLVFANKQDLPGAVGQAEIITRLQLNQLKNRQWAVQVCTAKEGTGLKDGLTWLADH